MSVMYVDIATIPDFKLGTRLYDLHELSEQDVARVMATKSRENSSNPGDLGQHMLQVAAMSFLLHDDNGIKIRSAGVSGSTEAAMLQTLQQLMVEDKPSVVTWDGKRSILPVLNYRYLSHGLSSPQLINHVDLAVELSGSSEQDSASLHEVAVLCGFPGNRALSSDDVLNAYLEGNIGLIQNNLEQNIMNTWLLNQRWKLLCGKLDHSSHEIEYQQFKEALLKQNKAHLTNFAESMT